MNKAKLAKKLISRMDKNLSIWVQFLEHKDASKSKKPEEEASKSKNLKRMHPNLKTLKEQSVNQRGVQLVKKILRDKKINNKYLFFFLMFVLYIKSCFI